MAVAGRNARAPRCGKAYGAADRVLCWTLTIPRGRWYVQQIEIELADEKGREEGRQIPVVALVGQPLGDLHGRRVELARQEDIR